MLAFKYITLEDYADSDENVSQNILSQPELLQLSTAKHFDGQTHCQKSKIMLFVQTLRCNQKAYTPDLQDAWKKVQRNIKER